MIDNKKAWLWAVAIAAMFLSQLLAFQRPLLTTLLFLCSALVVFACAVSIGFESAFRTRTKVAVACATVAAGLLFFALQPYLALLSARVYHWRHAPMLTQMVEMVRPLDTREYIWRLRPCSAFEDVPGETCARLQELMQQVVCRGHGGSGMP